MVLGVLAGFSWVLGGLAIEGEGCFGAEGLDRGGDFSLKGEMTEEGFNLGAVHFLGVTLVMRQNVTTNPLNVGFSCTMGAMFEPN
jgi:hypothetical protein